MNIVFSSATIAPGNGGIARVGRLTLSWLLKNYSNVRAISFLDDSFEFEGVRVKGFRGSKARFLLDSYMLSKWADLYVYDYVGIARAHPRFFNFQRPYKVWMHGIEAWEEMRSDAGRLFSDAEQVFVNSNYTLSRHRKLWGGGANARVCWLGTEHAGVSSPKLESRISNENILILGRMERGEGQKGHKECIDAWDKISSMLPKANLYIVGGGSALDDYKKAASASANQDRIKFTGFVEEAEIERYWDKASVLLLPSKQEGFGLVYVEAMERGIPVIASTNDAGAEINQHGITGLNVDPDDPNAIAAAVIELLSNEEQFLEYSRNARKFWAENFTRSNFDERFGGVFEK